MQDKNGLHARQKTKSGETKRNLWRDKFLFVSPQIPFCLATKLKSIKDKRENEARRMRKTSKLKYGNMRTRIERWQRWLVSNSCCFVVVSCNSRIFVG